MSLVKLKDKRTGTIYVYESESYWDKEKKQPRSRRKLIGKLDEETGDIIPTGKSGRKKDPDQKMVFANQEENGSPEPITEYVRAIAEKDEQIRMLKAENRALRGEKQDILKTLEALCQRLTAGDQPGEDT